MKMAVYLAETWLGYPLKCERVRAALEEHIKKSGTPLQARSSANSQM